MIWTITNEFQHYAFTLESSNRNGTYDRVFFPMSNVLIIGYGRLLSSGLRVSASQVSSVNNHREKHTCVTAVPTQNTNRFTAKEISQSSHSQLRTEGDRVLPVASIAVGCEVDLVHIPGKLRPIVG